MEKASTYRDDLFYINRIIDKNKGTRSEKIVSRLYFWAFRIFHPFVFKKLKNKNVLREKSSFYSKCFKKTPSIYHGDELK